MHRLAIFRKGSYPLKASLVSSPHRYFFTRHPLLQHRESVESEKDASDITSVPFVIPKKNTSVDYESQNLPHNYWTDKQNQYDYIHWVASKLGIQSMEDWYSVKSKDILDNGGRGILTYYNFSPSQLITTLYPSYPWLPWRFNQVPKDFWNSTENKENYMKWLANELGIKSIEDWYTISTKTFIEYHGAGLLKQYNNSPMKLITSIFPNHTWLPWKFNQVPRDFWSQLENQKKYIKWLSEEINIKSMDDWYHVSKEDFIRNYGGALLQNYNGSPTELINSIYSNYSWKQFKFSVVSKKSLAQIKQDVELQKEFIQFFCEKEFIRDPKDLLCVTDKQLKKYLSLSLSDFLNMVYHHYPELKNCSPCLKKNQKILYNYIRELFPNEEISEDYKHQKLISKNTNRPYELDIYIPSINLAFEYQGEQHYKIGIFGKSELSVIQYSDQQKSIQCKEIGITLVPIPYWWDMSLSSLKATIFKLRPELFNYIKPDGIPISNQPKVTDLKSTDSKWGFMLATNWEIQRDPTGWWMSEKYDGIRVLWYKGKLYSRSGAEIKIPDSLKQNLPNITLDGELWVKYGLQQAALQVINTTNELPWRNAKFCVFDVPEIPEPFESRLETLLKLKENNKENSFLHFVDHVPCKDQNDMDQFFKSVVTKGGEGIILREPGSYYTKGYSTSLCKYKSYYDTEVILESKKKKWTLV